MTEKYDGTTELSGQGKDRRRENFCHQFVVDFNGTKAAIRAGYSEKSAHVTASRLLSDDKVQARVSYLAKKVRESVKVDAEWVLQRLVMMATADITQIMDELGKIKDPAEWPEDVKAVLSGFDVNTIMDNNGNTGGMLIQKIRRTDPLKSLELLGRHKAIQAFKDQVEVDAGDNLVSAIMAGRKRAMGEGDDD